jgi:hypothetical protein
VGEVGMGVLDRWCVVLALSQLYAQFGMRKHGDRSRMWTIQGGESIKGEVPFFSIREVRHVGHSRRSTRFFLHTIDPAPVGRRTEECGHTVDLTEAPRVWNPVVEVGMRVKWKAQF